MANINYYNKHYDDAAVHFRKAGNFLSGTAHQSSLQKSKYQFDFIVFKGDLLLDQSDQCMDKCAECLIYMNEFQEASNIYKIIG
jgi:hypothetical protein